MGFWSKVFGEVSSNGAPALTAGVGGVLGLEQSSDSAQSSRPNSKSSKGLSGAAAKSLAEASLQEFATGTRISYDATLVEQLKNEHRQVLALFTEVSKCTDTGDTERAAKLLREFSTEIQKHLLTEEVRMYVYLQYTLRGHERKRTFVSNMRREMSDIGKQVLQFLRKYKAIDSAPQLSETFPADLKAVGELLVDRITREESELYPLYLPPALRSVPKKKNSTDKS